MLVVSEYAVKPFMSKEEGAELMALFAEVGNVPGTVAHYLDVTGNHGWVITETDDVGALHRNALAYSPYLEITATVVRTVEEGLGDLLAALA